MATDPTPEALARDRAWRAEAARRYAMNATRKPLQRRPLERTPAKAKPARRAPRRNDGPWREACIVAYGERCAVPGCGERGVEMDHIKPRGQGGQSVVENGIPLCGPFSSTTPGGHHLAKTEGRLRFRPEWLTPAQQTYLATLRWVDWDEDGQPFGEGWRHFTERTA